MENQKEVKNAEVELDETEQVNRCYRHVNQLGITPPPWAVCKEPKNDQWYKGTTIYSTKLESRVADTSVLSYAQDANNNLICAAPDLYEALKTILAKYRQDLSFSDVMLMEDALNKAAGKTVD